LTPPLTQVAPPVHRRHVSSRRHDAEHREGSQATVLRAGARLHTPSGSLPQATAGLPFRPPLHTGNPRLSDGIPTTQTSTLPSSRRARECEVAREKAGGRRAVSCRAEPGPRLGLRRSRPPAPAARREARVSDGRRSHSHYVEPAHTSGPRLSRRAQHEARCHYYYYYYYY
jgi:hypothetical protein